MVVFSEKEVGRSSLDVCLGGKRSEMVGFIMVFVIFGITFKGVGRGYSRDRKF